MLRYSSGYLEIDTYQESHRPWPTSYDPDGFPRGYSKRILNLSDVDITVTPCLELGKMFDTNSPVQVGVWGIIVLQGNKSQMNGLPHSRLVLTIAWWAWGGACASIIKISTVHASSLRLPILNRIAGEP